MHITKDSLVNPSYLSFQTESQASTEKHVESQYFQFVETPLLSSFVLKYFTFVSNLVIFGFSIVADANK